MAGLVDTGVLEVNDEVVQERIPPIEAVEELRPPSAVVVHGFYVSDGLAAAQIQTLLGHADAVLKRRNDPQAKEAGRSFE